MPCVDRTLNILHEAAKSWFPWVSTVRFVNLGVIHPHSAMTVLGRKGYEIDRRQVKGKSYNEYRLVGAPDGTRFEDRSNG